MNHTFKFREGDQDLKVIAQLSYVQSVEKDLAVVSKVSKDDLVAYTYEFPNVQGPNAYWTTPDYIRNTFPWAVALLPLMKMTPKQAKLLALMWVQAEVDADHAEELMSVTWFVDDIRALGEQYDLTDKFIEGTLSSLWVKGYITMQSLATATGTAMRKFELTPLGFEYMRQIQTLAQELQETQGPSEEDSEPISEEDLEEDQDEEDQDDQDNE